MCESNSKTGICSKCGGGLDRYNGFWCPKCDKPSFETTKVYNLIKVARYLEAQEDGYPPNFEVALFELLEVRGNDTHIPYYIEDPEEMAKFPEFGLMQQLTEGLIKHFGLKINEEILLEVSW